MQDAFPEEAARMRALVAGWPDRLTASGRMPLVTSPELKKALMEAGYWTGERP